MVGISGIEQGSVVAERYRVVERLSRFAVADRSLTGVEYEYWLAFDETRAVEVWLQIGDLGEVTASGAQFAGAVAALRRLNHPAFPAILDFGEVEVEVEADGEAADAVVADVGYAVLEPVEGESLAALLMRGALTEAEIFAALAELADALKLLHEMELVHGHLSAYSVLLTERGVLLVDVAASLALENASGSVLTPAADVYALAWLACVALAGIEAVEAEFGVGFDAASSPEDERAPGFLTAELIERRRAWAARNLVAVYGLEAGLAALLVEGLGESAGRPATASLAGALRSRGAVEAVAGVEVATGAEAEAALEVAEAVEVVEAAEVAEVVAAEAEEVVEAAEVAAAEEVEVEQEQVEAVREEEVAVGALAVAGAVGVAEAVEVTGVAAYSAAESGGVAEVGGGSGAGGGVAVATMAAEAPFSGGGYPETLPQGSGSGSGPGGGPSRPGQHRRPKSALYVAVAIVVLVAIAIIWGLSARGSNSPSPSVSGSAGPGVVRLPSNSAPASSAPAGAPSASAIPSATSGVDVSPSASVGATQSAPDTSPSPGALATAPGTPSQALQQIQQAVSQAQGAGQIPASAQGPLNQAIGTLHQEISSGGSVTQGVGQLRQALGAPGLPESFVSQINSLIQYLTAKSGS